MRRRDSRERDDFEMTVRTMRLWKLPKTRGISRDRVTGNARRERASRDYEVKVNFGESRRASRSPIERGRAIPSRLGTGSARELWVNRRGTLIESQIAPAIYGRGTKVARIRTRSMRQ